MRISKIGTNSFACIGVGDDALHSYGSNQGLIIDSQSSLVFDTGFHKQTATQILTRVKQKSKRIIVVNSHYHSDHVFGNNVFADARASIIAHEKCRRTMWAKSQKLLNEYRRRDPRLSRLLRGVEVAYPGITYRDRISSYLDEELSVDIIHPETSAHTDGDSMLFVRTDRVLFAGDILWVGYHPNLEDADIQGQVRALRTILKLNPRKIVPGHGPVSGLREVKSFIRYMEEFGKNAGKGLTEGLTGDELVRRVIPSWSWHWKMRWLAESYIRGLPKKSSATFTST